MLEFNAGVHPWTSQNPTEGLDFYTFPVGFIAFIELFIVVAVIIGPKINHNTFFSE